MPILTDESKLRQLREKLESLKKSREWFHDSLPNCCGELDSDGVCFAPACSRGEALGSIDDMIDLLEKT